MPSEDLIVKVDKSGKFPVYTVRKILTDKETNAVSILNVRHT